MGTGEWYYSTSISRNINSLTPISTNTFKVYSDKYGSKKSNYAAILFMAFNPAGQTFKNYVGTGSKLLITWSGLTTHENCQVWVEGESAVELECWTSSTSITVISRYYDYTTSNNIFISLGLTNPTSASTTFTAKLYDYYYSGSRYSLTISRTATYSTDTSFNSYSRVSKSTVEMYPFLARINTVANAPLRIRFKIPSSSVSGTGSGALKLTYSQIGYSTAHYCYIVKYASYAAMMQQTERTIYRTRSCTASGTSITAYPAYTLTISTSNYYELVMMPLGINSAGCSALGCVTMSGYQQTNFDNTNFIAYSNINTPSVIAQQVQRIYSYEGSKMLGLQHIYVLTTEPTETSLYLSINVNFTSSNNFPTHYLEVILYDLTIAAFPGKAVGDIVPCQLSPAFNSVNARVAPQCRVVKHNKINGYIAVRIENIGFLSQQVYWVSLDDITFPSPTQTDNNQKFDIGISYYGPSNVRYHNYFP